MGKKNLNIKLPEAMLDELEIIRRERSQQEGRRVSRNSLISHTRFPCGSSLAGIRMTGYP